MGWHVTLLAEQMQRQLDESNMAYITFEHIFPDLCMKRTNDCKTFQLTIIVNWLQ